MTGASRTSAATSDLLGAAIHRHRALSLEGLLERVFTRLFSELVYPQIWEDPAVDMAALEITDVSRIVTIASGGCNALSYLTCAPEKIFAVDLNGAHVALNRLKRTAARHIDDHETFFRFIGNAGKPGNSEIYWSHVAPHLEHDARRYWEGRDRSGRRRIHRFNRGFYKTGVLGRTIGFAHALALMHGADPRRMIRARTREDQVRLFEMELAPLFDRPLIRALLGKRAALYGLGIPPSQYDALLGDAEHMADVVKQRLRRLACDFDLDDNYFAWQAFNRGYSRYESGPLPPYLQPANFAVVKANVDRLSIEQTSLTTFLTKQPAASLDRFVLLDAVDWMQPSELSLLFGQIARTARPGARVIFRTAGETTILPGRVAPALLEQWRYEGQTSRTLTRRDRSAIYGGFHLYVRR